MQKSLAQKSLAQIAGGVLLASAAIAAPSGAAETGATTQAVVAIVKIQTPWYVPTFVVRGKMRDTEPQYAALPGLLFKYFSISQDDKFGGIYLWRDAATARAWFSDAWYANILRTRGAPADVRFFSVVRVRDIKPGGVRRDDRSDTVATLLTVSRQGGVVADTDPDPGPVPGLLRRYEVRDADGRPALIDLWSGRDAADGYYDAARLGRLRASLGEVRVEHFATPILLPSSLPENQMAARP